MAEAARNTYATTAANASATTPNQVAVVNDGTGDRQIVVLGAGDGTTTLVDGTAAHPLATAGNVASAAADSGNPIKTGGVYNSTNITLLTGQRGDAQMTANGFTRVDLGTLISGEDQTNNLLKVSAVGGLMPTNTALNTYQAQLTTNVTTTVTAATAYISELVIMIDTAGTTSTITIQDAQATPLKLIKSLVTATAYTTPTVFAFQTPIKMTSGISIVTAGAAAATVNVWISYYQ